MKRYFNNCILFILIFALSFTGIDANVSALVCTQTAEETAISNAAIINRNASCIVVCGARRYINYDDPREVPEIIDGSIYLPARTLALALGCYFENLTYKNYILMRNDEFGRELYFSPNGSYVQDEMGAKNPINYRIIYKNGNAYIPVRAIAELFGKTVNYREGIVIIDNKENADNLMEESLFSYIKSLFDGFVPVKSRNNIYHVAQSERASDKNPGTEIEPFRTLEKACSVAAAGDTVIIHQGIYREILKPLNDGTATNPIAFKGAEGEKIVLSATEVIDDFTQEDNFAVATIPKDLGSGRNQLFYNGECLAEGRYPDNAPILHMSDVNEPLSPLYITCGDLKVNSTNNKEVVSDTLLDEEEVDYWKGATFVSVHGKAYVAAAAKVEASEKGKISLGSTSKKFWHDSFEDDVWNYGYLTDHISTVTLPGEWAVENDKVYIIPPNSETAESLSVEMKVRQITIDLESRKFVHVVGLESFGGGAKLNDSEMCVLNNVDMKYISHYIYSDDQRNGYIDDAATMTANSAPARGEVGVYVGGRDNAIIHSKIDHSAGAGIYMTGLYSYIDDNIISNCGYTGGYVSGITVCNEPWNDIAVAKGGFSIYNNTIYNSGRYLFVIQGIAEGTPFLPFEIAYNDFHDGSLCTLDTGYVYAYGINAGTDRRVSGIHSNYLYSTSSKSNPFSFGIYCDGGSAGIDCCNNVIFTTKADTEFTHGYAYKNKTLSTCTLRANSQLKAPVTNGVAGLGAENFPKNKPFYAGALQVMTPYTANYLKADENVLYIAAQSGAKTGGIIDTDDKGVKFGSTEDELTFEDVEIFGENKNLVFYFGGDSAKYADILSVTLKKDANETIYEIPLETKAKTLYEIDFTDLKADVEDGIYDIGIKTRKISGDTHFYGMSVTSNGRAIKDELNGNMVLATDYSRICKIGNSSDAFIRAAFEDRTGYSYMMNTYSGAMLVYKNVVIENDVNTLTIAAGQAVGANPISIEFRLESPNADPIAVYNVEQSTWYDRSFKEVALTESISQGSYDIYVEFKSDSSATSNFYSFGFVMN